MMLFDPAVAVMIPPPQLPVRPFWTGYPHEADRECIGKSYPAQSNRPIRIGDAEDGSFYVVYQLGGNIRIDKFNACTTSASPVDQGLLQLSHDSERLSLPAFVGCEVKNGG